MESKNSITKIALLAFILTTFTIQFSQGQTFAEFFKQKKTQKKYLLQQIVALQVYLEYAKKGHSIANNGLQTIKGFTNGEFSLHNAFITSLKAVNPLVRNNFKIVEIIETQLRIKKAFGSLKSDTKLSIGNQLYIIDVQDKVFGECGKDLEELLLVITSGKLEMSDRERLRRLDSIYESISDKYAFTLDFTGQVMMLISQTEQERDFIYQLRRDYEIE